LLLGHVHYTDQPEKLGLEPDHKDIELGNLTNRWIGLKTIIYNNPKNGMIYPTMEMWIDQTNNGTWKKVHEYTDKGSWGSTMNRCGGGARPTNYVGLSCHYLQVG
jgi:hypothetical protein